MAGIIYDTTVLIAAERGDRRMWSRHQGLLRLGTVPVVPAPVLAQAWRGGSRQALLARLLTGCEIEAMTEQSARAVGRLLGAAAHDDVVDVRYRLRSPAVAAWSVSWRTRDSAGTGQSDR